MNVNGLGKSCGDGRREREEVVCCGLGCEDRCGERGSVGAGWSLGKTGGRGWQDCDSDDRGQAELDAVRSERRRCCDREVVVLLGAIDYLQELDGERCKTMERDEVEGEARPKGLERYVD